MRIRMTEGGEGECAEEEEEEQGEHLDGGNTESRRAERRRP